ncbi:biotin/lipoyl-containing protein [Aggregatilinea lenta]|uniref:biotin/lipoyl-containing protein n=1 Tax=Aggregatilinea lenta TaxID=913108 RepID=UPI000E5B5A18|nr:acetyl-CoA carboxylase biotin carboxyl carrier protein subunit [Aggregatilinea lenta]
MKYQTIVNGKTYEIEINEDGRLLVNGEEHELDFRVLREGELYSMLLDNCSFEAVVDQRDEILNVLMNGNLYEVQVTDERSRRLASAFMHFGDISGEVHIRAPMPGLIARIPVTEGQQVSKGETLVILESMKMENELKAPRDGTVHRINVAVGASVEQNKVLVTLA